MRRLIATVFNYSLNGLLPDDGSDDYHIAAEGTQLFDDVPKSYRLDLISSTAWHNGVLAVHYRRDR